MKSTLLSALVITFSMAAFAQNSTTSGKSNAYQSKHKGIKAAVVYSNLTDVSGKSTVDGTYGNSSGNEYHFTRTDTYHNGTHLGLAGINVGYKDDYAFGSLGYEASGSILKSINKSESEDSITVYKVQGDLVLPLSDMFSLLGGLNVSYFSFSNNAGVKVTPAAGLDIGVQGQFGDVGVMLGSQTLGMNAESKENSSYKSEALVSGFITQVSYTF